MSSNPLNQQSGMVLLLCLMFLTALTLLGLSASADTILQNQLAANLQQTEHARQSANISLGRAEKWLNEFEGPVPETCSDACKGFTVRPANSNAPYPEFESLAWWQAHGYVAGIDPLTGERLANIDTSDVDPALWLIEVMHDIPVTEGNLNSRQVWYRLLARGTGRTDTAISVLESIVIKSWPATDGQANGRVSWQELR